MSPANPLSDLAGSLERFREQVENALALAGRETAGVEDELAEHAGAARRELMRARDEGAPWEQSEELERRWVAAQRLQRAWAQARGEYEEQARRLWRFLDEKAPLMRTTLRTAVLAPPPEEESAAIRPTASRPSSAPAPGAPSRSERVAPTAPRVEARAGIDDPAKEGVSPAAAPEPSPSRAGELTSAPSRVGVPAATAPSRRQVPSTTPDLRQAWGRLQARWREATGAWRGPERQGFEEACWGPLESEVQATLRQMEQLGEAADGILRETC
jgi:hypothetical protein